MDDRRQSNRIDASNEGLRVINGVDGEQLGIVGNLSLGGMMLITTRRELYADGIPQLQIDVAPEAGWRTHTAGCQGVVVYAGQQPGRALGGPGNHRYRPR